MNNTDKKIIQKRNYGIDVLRIVAMLMIITLHVLGLGGIIRYSEQFSLNYEVAWIMEIMAYCGVNCYALISGYVSIGRKHKYHKILTLWFQVFFYTILITTVIFYTQPSLVGIKEWIKAFLPGITGQYWYFTAYIGLFFFSPFLNKILSTWERGELKKLIATVIILFSIIPTIVHIDIFSLENGYSFVWLIVLYLIGGYIKKYNIEDSVSKKQCMVVYFLCMLFTWGVKDVIERGFSKILEYTNLNEMLIAYTSPTMLFAGISLVIFFAKLEIKRNVTKKLIGFLASASFSVYIIHMHPLCYHFLEGSFIEISYGPLLSMVAKIIVFVFGVYLICSLVDFIRAKIFVVLKVDFICQKIWEKFSKLFQKASHK